MKKTFPVLVNIFFATLLVAARPTECQADFKVSVRSLRDVFLGKETNQAFKNALAANPVTVTVTDVERIQPTVFSTFNADELTKEITVPSGNAQTVIVVFSCPGLRTATLDPVINLENAAFEVAMPLDAGSTCCYPYPVRHRFFRRR